MNNIVNKDSLFCDEYRALILLEYPKELALVKQLIELAVSAIEQKAPTNTWSHEGICRMFAKSIAEYLKMSYDNLQIGHFYATQMIFRTIVENIICLDVIQRHPEQELWKYYMVQSFRDSLKSFGEDFNEREQKLLEELYRDHNIDREFIIKSKKKDNQRPFFSLNMEQMQHTVRQHYGEGFNAHKYIERFFDLTIPMPRLKRNKLQEFLIHISMIGIYNFLCLWVFVCTVRFRAASGLGIMPRGGSGGQNGDMDLKCCRKEKCRTKAVGSRFPPAARFLRIFLILRNFYWNFEGLSDTSSMACKRLRKSRLAAF